MQSQEYICSVNECDYTTNSSRGLSVHKSKRHNSNPLVDTNCDNCGGFVTRREDELGDNVFCCQECYHDWNTGSNHANSKEKELLTCEFCEKEYKEYQYRAEESRFCSQECSGKYKTEQGTKNVSCDWCDEEFTKSKRAINRSEHNFCSKSCYGKWSSVNKTGQNHPNWTGGSNLYEAVRENLSSKSWGRIAELSRNNSCYKCGDDAENLHEHHIIPVMYGGVNSEELLMTLCAPCHRTVESYIMKELQTNIAEV